MKLMFATIALAIVVCGVASAKGYRYHAPKTRTYHYAVPKLSGSPTHVRGYMKRDGTYVMPHYQTAPNATKLDNWTSKPNVNPYTGKQGTKDPYKSTCCGR